MAKKLWGGRFTKKIDEDFEEFSKSIHYDYKLAETDLLGSQAHVRILEKAEFLKKDEADKLYKGLQSILDEVRKGTFKWDKNCEDIHTDIQNKLQKDVGDLALKLHTARSRNDQVVFATKFYCKDLLVEIINYSDKLKIVLQELAKKNEKIIIPGFTHMQHAQPVYLKDYLHVYVEMLARDRERLLNIEKNMKITLGAGALAGTPISSVEYAVGASKFLKGRKLAEDFNITATVNSLDSVSDRDFVIEILSALAIVGMHLSRMAEDFIIWSTKEFNFIEIDEAFCTGSSLMPQKKNADVLELIRGYAGRLTGNLVSVLTMMKGLPLTYNRDMQLDKEPLFESFEIIGKELKILAGFVKALKFKEENIKKHLEDESLYATDLVYYLVEKKEPFTIAHSIIGKLVRYSMDKGVLIKNMTQDQLDMFSKKLKKEEIVKLFDPRKSVEGKISIDRSGEGK